MATLIAFSAQGGDYILVAEDLAVVAERLGEDTSRFVSFTQIPGQGQRFQPGAAYVNPARVAYVREPARPVGA